MGFVMQEIRVSRPKEHAMTNEEISPPAIINGWRIAGWGALLALLALPAIAMQFSQDVSWTARDFVFAAVLLGALGLGVEFAVRVGNSGAHKAGLIAAALTAFATLWANAAVGIVGDGPINIAFAAMVAAGLIAGVLTKFQARQMAAITGAMVACVLAVGLIAEFTFQPDWVPVLFIAALWMVPALLFRRASKD